MYYTGRVLSNREISFVDIELNVQLLLRKINIINLVACLLVILEVSPAHTSDFDVDITCLHRTADTEQTLSLVKAGLSTIPDSIKKPLFDAGYKIVITPTMLYGKSVDDFERRGNYDVASANNIAGQFRSSEHTVYIPERCSYGSAVPKLQGEDLKLVLRHEFGHAYDAYLSFASQSDKFSQAYNEDSSRLTNSQRRNFSYFAMQEPGTSATELFAELFSIICTPSNQPVRSYDKDLYEAFPHCVAIILSRNQDLQPHVFGSGYSYAGRAKSTTGRAAIIPGTAAGSASKASSPAAPSILSMAVDLINRHQYAEAIPYLSAAIASDPINAVAYSYRGYSYLAIGDYASAINDYTMTIRLNPADLSARRNLELAKTMAKK